ncbi:hypothetical protein E6O75_ATG02196 [Venturia nashicola]|uniref:Uncharacterized protein n=1 Tax=Venturia nashicola TaxID=86259 RepID=A0A4Z1PKX3_9PEZI|nr:hypothetical protein E6O75_ATG02196 [Venturia nashicola]
MFSHIHTNDTNDISDPRNQQEEPTLIRDIHFIWFIRTMGAREPGIAYTTKAEAMIDARARVSRPPMAYLYEPVVEHQLGGGHMKVTRRVHAHLRYENGPQDLDIRITKVELRERF